MVFIAAYTNRVAHEARQLADALTATELALSRHEQLSALDGLAAAAAHELGTPLSTIALAAKEMKADIPPGPLRRRRRPHHRAIGPLPGDPRQAPQPPQRRRRRSVRRGADGRTARGSRARRSKGCGKSIFIEMPETLGEPVFKRNVGLLYGLGNLIENATQFAATAVTVEASWDRASIGVIITDDGPGFPDELIARLGEPYLTTRARNAAPDGDAPGGLGLGIFIAKTLLERTGARARLRERRPPAAPGSRIVWPRKRHRGLTVL